MNTLHYAIHLEKISFLSYLLEGDFEAYKEGDLELKYQNLLKLLNEPDKKMEKQWIIESLKGLERFSLNEGYSVFSLAIKSK